VTARGRPALTEVRVVIPSMLVERARRRATLCGITLDRWFAEAAEVALVQCRHRHDPVREVPPPDAGREDDDDAYEVPARGVPRLPVSPDSLAAPAIAERDTPPMPGLWARAPRAPAAGRLGLALHAARARDRGGRARAYQWRCAACA
jgi:hypothetical protein